MDEASREMAENNKNNVSGTFGEKSEGNIVEEEEISRVRKYKQEKRQ
jgi:hypothetical protein